MLSQHISTVVHAPALYARHGKVITAIFISGNAQLDPIQFSTVSEIGLVPEGVHSQYHGAQKPDVV